MMTHFGILIIMTVAWSAKVADSATPGIMTAAVTAGAAAEEPLKVEVLSKKQGMSVISFYGFVFSAQQL